MAGHDNTAETIGTTNPLSEESPLHIFYQPMYAVYSPVSESTLPAERRIGAAGEENAGMAAGDRGVSGEERQLCQSGPFNAL